MLPLVSLLMVGMVIGSVGMVSAATIPTTGDPTPTATPDVMEPAASNRIVGHAWIDANCDGIRQDGEAPALLGVYLITFGLDDIPFTSDDRQLDAYGVGADGQYRFTRGAPGMRFRLSILFGTWPDGYMPTKYRQGSDSTRWSSLQANWTTGDPNNGGFTVPIDPVVDGGNIGIAPVACQSQWYTNHVRLPLVVR